LAIASFDKEGIPNKQFGILRTFGTCAICANFISELLFVSSVLIRKL
jgi:hypothetical protein